MWGYGAWAYKVVVVSRCMREGKGENMLLPCIGYWPVKLKIGLLSPEKVGKATIL